MNIYMATEEKILDRALYKKIKGMDREAMERTIQTVFAMGYDKAIEECPVDVNLEELENELSQIKGIGQNRLKEIMEVIEDFLSKSEVKAKNEK